VTFISCCRGHDQHFGPLVVQNTYMGHRHLTNWATFATYFNLPMRLDGLDILDVGVMAGGKRIERLAAVAPLDQLLHVLIPSQLLRFCSPPSVPSRSLLWRKPPKAVL
jgi:hypothetical protein